MRRADRPFSIVLLMVVTGCQTGLPTEKIVDETPPAVPAKRTPPLSGGTLLVTRDMERAVVADPARDRVVLVDLASGTREEIPLSQNDEPGRLVEGDGVVYVALRKGGAIAVIDLAAASVVERPAVCDGPRGLAYDETKDQLHVACASGEVVTLATSSSLEEARRVFVAPDLRDVILRGDELLVTHFRSAEVTQLSSAGVALRTAPAPYAPGIGMDEERISHVAWRTLPLADGSIAILHQTELANEIDISPPVGDSAADEEGAEQSPYGAECEGELVRTQISVLRSDLELSQPIGDGRFNGMRLPLDFAISAEGTHAVVIDPAANIVKVIDLDQVAEGCFPEDSSIEMSGWLGVPIAVAYLGNDILVETREPATLQLLQGSYVSRRIDLGGESVADTGFDLFHNTSAMNIGTGLACASCHPEGRDDGHVWKFSGEGLRRTQSLAGTLLGTAPFHWGGNLPNLGSLMDEVSTRRMGGVVQSPARVETLESWLLGLEPVRVATAQTDPEAVVRGKALFEDEVVGCAGCHSGPAFTNNETVEVGRGDALQVPSLIGVGTRAPFMHDGCGATLLDRFEPSCAGDAHGDTSLLDQAALADLVAYMNSL